MTEEIKNEARAKLLRKVEKKTNSATRERQESVAELKEIMNDRAARGRLATIALQSVVDEDYTSHTGNFYRKAEEEYESRKENWELVSLPTGMFRTDQEIIEQYLKGVLDDEIICLNLAQGIRCADFLLFMNTHFVNYELQNYLHRMTVVEIIGVIEGLFIAVAEKYKDIHQILDRVDFSDAVLEFLDRDGFRFESGAGNPFRINLTLGEFKERTAEEYDETKVLNDLSHMGHGMKKRYLINVAKDIRQGRINEFIGELKAIIGEDAFDTIQTRLTATRQMRNKVHYHAIENTIREGEEFNFQTVSDAFALLEEVTDLMKRYAESRGETAE